MHYAGYAATILTIATFIPQTVKAFRSHHTKDLSLSTYCLLVVVSILWTIYGLSIHSPEIYITNTTVGLLSLIICGLKIKNG
jgi:MtN3 and saliva related transmembrane protein